MTKQDAENKMPEPHDELDAVSTPEELVIYFQKQAAKRAVESPGQIRKGLDAKELAKMKEVITDIETADKFIEAMELIQAQGMKTLSDLAERLMDELDKIGSKGFYSAPLALSRKKGN